jgi:hypothetical protein
VDERSAEDGWYGVRTVVRFAGHAPATYEERLTLWREWLQPEQAAADFGVDLAVAHAAVFQRS